MELLRSSVHRLGYHQRRCGYVNPVTEQVDDFLSKYSPEIATLGRAARRTMRQILPGWSEFIYDNYNALVFGFAPTDRPSDAIFSIALYPKWVRLFFLQAGPSLRDPQKLLSGTGTVVRSLVLTSAKDLDSPPVRALMAQAMKGITPLPSKKGSSVVRSVSARQRPRR